MDIPKIILKSSPNHPKIILKSSPNHPKTIPKSSQNHFIKSKNDPPKHTKSQKYFWKIGFLTFSARFVGSYPPKVDKMSMKSHMFIDFRQKLTVFCKNRFQKPGFRLKNQIYLVRSGPVPKIMFFPVRSGFAHPCRRLFDIAAGIAYALTAKSDF